MTPETEISSESLLAALARPYTIIASSARHRHLLAQLLERELLGRYRRSRYGLFWIFVQPLLLLLAYSLVFGTFLKSRWGGATSDADFALVLFSGLIPYNFFSEVISRAPSLVRANAPFVKKVVFPLELLNISVLGAALVHATVSWIVWIVAALVLLGGVPWTVFWVPVLFLPFALFTLGLGWLLSGFATYHPDAEFVVPVVLLLAMFLSPLFYPIDAVPERFRVVMNLNPLTYMFEAVRGAMLGGHAPEYLRLFAASVAGCASAWIGLASFASNKDGFADAV